MKALGRTAIYMRLSRDDERSGQSLSIDNQRAILTKYVQDNGGIVAGEYADDGWSGTDFDRPAVRQLFEDAKAGKIDTIVVKDLSRFGRNYIQVGQYTDYIFPACGIRFIALSDNVDTADRASAGMDMMPIMNVFNEWHAANTSKKIRAVLEANWRRGKYTNWTYPYGYVAGNDQSRTAIIDKDAAEIVKRIYDMRLQGFSAGAIARALSDEGIPNPSSHYTRLDGKKSERKCSPYWSPKTVAGILKDRTYTGALIQHRTTTFSYKNHKVIAVPKNEHIIKENAHEAIIDCATWQKVQDMSGGTARGRADKLKKVHPLSGLLVCADCGKKLKFRSGGKNRASGTFACRTYTDLGKKYCSSHSIAESTIEKIILCDIRAMLGEIVLDEQKERERFLSEVAKRGEENRISGEKELKALKNRAAELDRLISAAFEDKVSGALPENICKDLCEKYQSEKERTTDRIKEIEKDSAKQNNDKQAEQYLLALARYLGCRDLTREMCLQMIERVSVGQRPTDGESRILHIYYKFRV